MSDSVPTVLPALAVVAVLTASMVFGVYLAAGARSHRPGASSRPSRRTNPAQALTGRRTSPVVAAERSMQWNPDNLHADPPSGVAPAARVAKAHDLLRQSQSAPTVT